MGDFSDFSKSMQIRARAVSENADRLTRRIAIVADQAVVSATPVDTGRARSNWIASLDQANLSTHEPYAPGDTGSTGAANTQAALDQATRTVSGYNGDSHKEIHLTNNLPYIERLNQGWSRQAPAGFVEEALAATARAFDGMVISSVDGVPRDN